MKMLSLKNDKFFLFIVFVISLIVDSINGFLQIQLNIHTPVGVIFRLFVIFLLLKSIILNKRIFTTFIFLTVFILVPSMLYWQIEYGSDIGGEISDFSKIIYTFLFIIFFYIKWDSFEKSVLLKYIVIYGLLISLSVIVCFYFNIGNRSYHDYGFGTKAFFKAGNDIGLTIIFALLLSYYYFFKYSPNFLTFLKCIIISVGAIFIGSRTAIIMSILVTSIVCIYLIFISYNRKILFIKITIILMIVFLIPSFVNYVLLYFNDYMMSRFTFDSMESARTILTDAAAEKIANFDGFAILIGEGAKSLHTYIAETKYSGLFEEKYVEADLYEMIGSYGFLIGGSIIAFYFYSATKSLYIWFNKSNIYNFLLMTSIVSFIILGAIVGHALTNVMVAPLFAVAFVLLVKNNSDENIII